MFGIDDDVDDEFSGQWAVAADIPLPSNGIECYTVIEVEAGIFNCDDTNEVNVTFSAEGCTDELACNYNSDAICDDNSCEYIEEVELGEDIETCDESITLDAGEGYDSYSWSTGEDSQTITVTESGNYSIDVSQNESLYPLNFNDEIDCNGNTLIHSNSQIIFYTNNFFEDNGFQNGDVIGAFYNHPDCGLSSAGSLTYNENVNNLQMSVWGDDTGSSTIDGLANNQEIIWLLQTNDGYIYTINIVWDDGTTSGNNYNANEESTALSSNRDELRRGLSSKRYASAAVRLLSKRPSARFAS